MGQITKTIGGQRLGSGNRMKQSVHNYYRSNHNLSKSVKMSMAPGVLYPAYTVPVVNGDTFDIDINAFIRTIPTKAPLFGSFKLQVDFFTCPIRLYQGILHNNTLDIAMNADKVIFPKMNMITAFDTAQYHETPDEPYTQQIAPDSLAKFCGISGIGRYDVIGLTSRKEAVRRNFNALPFIAYYDIFKNYYANKQEDNAYVITGETEYNTQSFSMLFLYYNNTSVDYEFTEVNEDLYTWLGNRTYTGAIEKMIINTEAADLNFDKWYIEMLISDPNAQSIRFSGSINELVKLGYLQKPTLTQEQNPTIYEILPTNALVRWTTEYAEWNINISYNPRYTLFDKIVLEPFALSNIDEMRKRLLTQWDLGTEYVIDENYDLAPYNVNTKLDAELYNMSRRRMNGLCVKTYQSDLFNNWLNKESIEGLNGINETAAISTASGSFTIDTLNMATKLYNYLNRLALSDKTYEDWQEMTWGNEVVHRTEKPMYVGGMSSEVMFEEVVNMAESADHPLGALGGRGALNTKRKKGGKIVVKVKEPSLIIGIVSLTPRISYCQGNKWWATDLDNLADLHKPAFDQIGYQDALTERLAWWDTKVDSFYGKTPQRTAYGKLPAWIDYMTDYDECYGDFADDKTKSFMVLTRDYQKDPENFGVADVTTYIDPEKYNYAFAYTGLDAQNFWAFFSFDIKARRKMSAKQIPNL